MKLVLLICTILCILLNSCLDDCIMGYKRELTKYELEIIPYKKGDTAYFFDQYYNQYYMTCLDKYYREEEYRHETVECDQGADIEILYCQTFEFISNINYLESFKIEIESYWEEVHFFDRSIAVKTLMEDSLFFAEENGNKHYDSLMFKINKNIYYNVNRITKTNACESNYNDFNELIFNHEYGILKISNCRENKIYYLMD